MNNVVKYGVMLSVLWFTSIATAKEIKVGLTVGSGLFAIEEHNDKNIDMTFSAPLSFSASASIMDQRYNSFGIKMHYADSRVKGTNWLTGERIDGVVSLSSWFGYYEKIWKRKRIHHSVLGGFGFTNENYVIQLEESPKIRNYASLILGYSINYTISERLNLRTEISPIATDIFNGIRYFFSDWRGQSVGEDIHIFISIGFKYSLKAFKKNN